MSMTGHLLIYGATGYTGRRIAQAAVERGLRPILAGRNLRSFKPGPGRYLPWNGPDGDREHWPRHPGSSARQDRLAGQAAGT